MKEKCMQLKAYGGITRKEFCLCPWGGLNLAANLACMMNETPGLDKVFRMAIEAYDHVPMK